MGGTSVAAEGGGGDARPGLSSASMMAGRGAASGTKAVGAAGSRGVTPPTGGGRGAVPNTPASEEMPVDTGPVETSLKRLPDFAKPPASYRLKTRSGATASTLQELSKSGFGAVEGGGVSLDASLNTPLQAAKSAGMSVDLAPGGSMPYAAAGISEADSMQQLSRAVSTQLTSDGSLTYNSAPPRLPNNVLASSSTLKMVAVTAARVVEASGTTTVLDPDSAVDLTAMLDSSGQVKWTVPEGNWLVFGFWQRATGQTPNGFPPFQEPSYWSAQAPAQGFGASFMADIFSGVGIGKALAGLASLPANTLELLKGTQFAHDSHEVQAEMFWTGKLPEEFNTRRGYAMIKYLPALHTPKEASFDPLTKDWGVTPPLEPAYDFAKDVGARVRYDYHLTLNDLYVGEYLKTFTEVLNKAGMQSRAQVAYNYKPLNMTRAGVAVDIPENESLDSGWTTANDITVPTYGTERWRHAMDSYRLTGAGAHLGKGKRATLEFGDDFAIYRKQPIDYAQQLNEACAAGITMGLLTGFAGVSTGWPAGGGLAGIGIGDFWTTAWPQWRDWKPLADYFARSTVVLETGLPLMDAVIYLDEGLSGVHELTTPKFASSQLETAGFTYDFVDPVTLAEPRALEVPGVLFGHGPSYRVLILNQQPKIPATVAQQILAAAKGGVTVVIVGEPPHASPGLLDATAQDAAVAAAVAELITLDSVLQVATMDDVPSALLKHGITPAARFGESSPLLSVHRRTEDGEDIWWILNPSLEDAAATASFATRGTPYQLDLWNGSVERIALWKQEEGRLSLPLVLPARATTAFMFQHQGTPLHVTSTNAQGVAYDGDTLVLRDTQGGAKDASLSDGSTKTVQLTAPPAPIQVGNWSLVVDEISPTGNARHMLQLPELKDWRDIPEIKDAVGSGSYTANPDVPASALSDDRDVMIDVGAMHGAMQLSVNGALVTQQTTPGGRWSVRKLLKAGKNEITVRVDTLLINRVVQQDGGDASMTYPSGLIGPVQLIPVALARVPQ